MLENKYQATVLALHLALTAPDQDKADDCVNIAASFGLAGAEMDRAKAAALAMGDA
tara:strand:- start:77 stop:244 length:168 start_codon:yes stop_codon:yes gene_type:complete